MTASTRVKPAVVLALDIGTSQVRAFAYNDDLDIRAGSSRPVSTYAAAEVHPGSVAPADASVFDCISEITAESRSMCRPLSCRGRPAVS